MLTSQHRILNKHTGSLPRPAALTEMYATRAEGEAIDEAALDAAGKLATRHVVRQQIAAGIDVGNNRRAAARGVLSLRPPPDERVWRQLDPADHGRYRQITPASAPGRRSSKAFGARSAIAAPYRQRSGAVTYLDPGSGEGGVR